MVEQKIGQWPESPAPLPELLGPDGYETFKSLGSNTAAPYYANLLLTFYVHVLNEEDRLKARPKPSGCWSTLTAARRLRRSGRLSYGSRGLPWTASSLQPR